ncbi:MAG: IS110 family transposase [Acidobacteriaceae bacterium]|nr:IS110 family transposase [Acidobacteriaceae bacterium]
MTQDGVTLWLGIDWADEKHRWAMRIDGEARIQQGELEHTPEAVEQFVSSLALRFPGQRIAVALEQSRGALLFLLSKYAHLVLYPLHPNTVNHYRKSIYPSGAKSDPSDAALILDILCKHPERLRPFQPDTVETRTLQLLVEARREAVDDKTRFLNRLTAQLKMFFPQVLDWFSTIDTIVVGQLLQKWPTLDKLQRASVTKVAAFLREHRIPESRITALQQLIQQSVVAIRDTAVLESSVLTVRRMIRQIEALRASIAEHDKRIAELAETHPDYGIFSSLPGAGPTMIPRLIAALGTQRERYATASAIQCYAGIAPVTETSGKQKWVHWRWACPKFLRQTFHEWAWLSTRKSAWAKHFYHQQRERNKSHHAAVRALSFKWLRIVFRCWKDRVPYEETRYILALQNRAVPKGVEIRLKTSTGFTQLEGISC